MDEELISRRLDYLLPRSWLDMGDNPLVERMWKRLDHALGHCRLEVHDEVSATETIRVVTVLGLFRIRVDHEGGNAWAYLIEEDGTFREINGSFHLYRLFHHPCCRYLWLRYAFQRWEPMCSDIDFVSEPLNRPCNAELDASRRLVRRLNLDKRYWTLAQDFDEAIGFPPLALSMMEEQSAANSCNLEDTNRIWQTSLHVLRAMRRAMALHESSPPYQRDVGKSHEFPSSGKPGT